VRERLEEVFSVSRLGMDGRLAKTLTTYTPVQSMISIAGTTDRNVTRWRDVKMVLRWPARDAQRRAVLPQDQGL
jgi:putative transposase